MQARDLEGYSRSDLIERAEALGVDKADLLTRAELTDEIVRRTVVDPIERRIARGLLGLARDLVARVVERGLHLPDAAAMIRGPARASWVPAKPPIATVTLAEIYAAQGHRARALSVLDEVLDSEADHAAARELRDQIAASPVEEAPPAPQPERSPPPPEPARQETPFEEHASAAAAPLPGDAELSFAPSSPATGSADERSDGSDVGSVASMPAASGGMLDDAPLPDRYDVDEVVLMPVDPKTVYVYWELRRRPSDEAAARIENGRLVLRIVAVTASWDAPVVETRDIEVRELVGDWFIRDLPVGAVLRAAIGWSKRAGFDPLSVAMEMTTPPGGPAPVGASELGRFTAEGIVPADARDDETLLAMERARRRVARDATSQEKNTWSSWPSMPVAPSSGEGYERPTA